MSVLEGTYWDCDWFMFTAENLCLNSLRQAKFSGGDIPDAQAVYLAIKRRQKAREGGEYIPLDDTQKLRKDTSRLVREDENEDSDMEEEGGRFYSSRKLRQLEEESKREAQEEFLDIEQGGLNIVERSSRRRRKELNR